MHYHFFPINIFCLVFALVAHACFPCKASAQDAKPEQTLSAGYTGYSIHGYWGTGNRAHLSAAIRLANPAEKGNRIIALRCAIGANESVADCKIFIKKDLEKDENLYEQAFVPAYGWNYIHFDFPFNTAGMEELYIGYELTTAEEAIGYGYSAEEGAGYLRVNNSAWTTLSQQGRNGAVHGMSAIFEGGDYQGYEQNAVNMEDALLPGRVKAGEDFLLEGTLDNLGVCTLRSFDVVCQINGGEETRHPQTCELMNRENQPFSFPIRVPEGKNTVRIRLDAANGESGHLHFDRTYTVHAYPKAFPKTLLVEYFTSQNCANCPEGKAVLDKALRGHEGETAMITHHAGFSNDLFTIQESLSLAERWDVLSAPSMMLDRSPARINGTEMLVFHPAYVTAGMIRERLADYALANVEISNHFYTDDNHLAIHAKVEKDEAFPASAKLHVFLCENGYAASQTGKGEYWENYEHNHFPRAVLSALEGDALHYNEEGVAEATYTYVIPAEYAVIGKEEATAAHPEKMEIVAFVANFDEATGNYTVHNAAVQPLNPTAGTSMQRPAGNGSLPFRLQAGKGCLSIEGDFERAEVYSLSGRLAATLGKARRTVLLPPGIYIVRTASTNGISVQKAIVKGF